MAIILQEDDSSQPSIRLDPPSGKIAPANLGNGNYPPTFAKLKGRGAKPGLGGIRAVRRQLTEAELLIPDMDFDCSGFGPGKPVSWLIQVDCWTASALQESLLSLALQEGSEQFQVIFWGQASDCMMVAAERVFPGRARLCSDIDEAVAAIETPFAGYVGPGVQLHDPRASKVLQKILIEDEAISSASCALVSAQRRGKEWKVEPVDVGQIPIDRAIVRGAALAHEALALWRLASFPVIQPPRGFWMARRESMLRWREGEAGPKELHLVSTLISASGPGDQAGEQHLFEPMPANKAWAISARVLVG